MKPKYTPEEYDRRLMTNLSPFWKYRYIDMQDAQMLLSFALSDALDQRDLIAQEWIGECGKFLRKQVKP